MRLNTQYYSGDGVMGSYFIIQMSYLMLDDENVSDHLFLLTGYPGVFRLNHLIRVNVTDHSPYC